MMTEVTMQFSPSSLASSSTKDHKTFFNNYAQSITELTLIQKSKEFANKYISLFLLKHDFGKILKSL